MLLTTHYFRYSPLGELTLLEKLYGLYTNVLTTVTEYNDYHWSDVLAEGNIELMTKKMEDFQEAIFTMAMLTVAMLSVSMLAMVILMGTLCYTYDEVPGGVQAHA